jgi:hypothetical protein
MRRLSIGASGTALAIGLAWSQAIGAGPGEAGGLIGVGVKSCEDFSQAEVSAGRGDDLGVLALRRQEDWAAGFVSGLNFAGGRDFLRHVPFAGFMRRVAQHCADHPRDDVFTAVNTVLKQLNAPEKE